MRTRCMISFSKVLVGVASGLTIEPGNDDAKIIMSGDFEQSGKVDYGGIGKNGDYLAPAIAGHVVGVEGGETGHPILGGMSITGPCCIERTGW